MTVQRNVMTGSRRQAADPAKIREAMSPPQRTWISRATVGHYDALTGAPEPNPAYVRLEQGLILVEVTLEPAGDQIVVELAIPDSGPGSGSYVGLAFGAQVVVEFINGSPQNGVIIGTLNNTPNPLPPAVCGVQTGAAQANAPQVGIPAPQWQFVKLPTGQLLAIETGPGGDVLIHSGGSVQVLANPAGAIHLTGRVALGGAPVSPPVGATVGPAGSTIPGVPAIAQPFVPVPVAQAPGSAPAVPSTPIPFVGMPDSIIRAKDGVQSHAVVDPYFFAWMIAVSGVPAVAAALVVAGLPGPPTALHCEFSGRNGPGSKHTASD